MYLCECVCWCSGMCVRECVLGVCVCGVWCVVCVGCVCVCERESMSGVSVCGVSVSAWVCV